MEQMHRTQIYLEQSLNDALNKLALRKGISKAHLVRLAARRLLEDEQQSTDEDSIVGVIGLGHGGPGNASVDHDRILAEQGITGTRA